MTLKIKLNHSKELQKVFEIAKKAGGEARFVGGAVRNFLLNNEPLEGGDIDISINLPVNIVTEIFTKAGAKVITKYATNIVVLNHKVFEITSTRKDENCDGRYAEMIFTSSFEEDAKRRDFTINALFMREDGEVFDFFNGLEDLKNKVVKFIGEPLFRIEEDGLRIWRFFRFSCLYSNTLNEDGLKACIKKRGILGKISKERVTFEMLKLLNGSPEMIKFVLGEMIKGEILNSQDFNLSNPLPQNNFERLVVINNGKFCETFLYTARQKKLINLYNKVRLDLKEKWKIYKLFYTLSKDDFNFIITIAKSLNEMLDIEISQKPLPFSKQSIMQEGFEGALITEEFNNRLNDFCKQII